MKKIILALLTAALVSGAVFAQGLEMSAGGGGALNMLFSESRLKGLDKPIKSDTIGGGVFAYFDLTYAEIDLDLLFSNSKNPDASDAKGTDMTHFGFSVLGKYPFALGKASLFPLVGIDYQIFMGGKNKDFDTEIKPDDLKGDLEGSNDWFSIAAGLGADFTLSGNLYLRAEFLWNFKLLSKMEDKVKDLYDTQFTSGPRVKLGIGCKFGKPKEKEQ